MASEIKDAVENLNKEWETVRKHQKKRIKEKKESDRF